MKWIRIWTQETLQSTTFQELNDIETGVWYKLLVIGGANIRNPGIIEIRDGVPYTDEMLATYINSPLNHLKSAKKKLLQVEKIEQLPDGRLKIHNFEKYQSRQLRYYHEHKCKKERKKSGKADFTVDKIREDKIRKDKSIKKRAVPFQKPSIEDIKTYCRERGNNVDAQVFYDFYESKGWMVGKSPMKDWKACVRTWEQRHKKDNKEDEEDLRAWKT